jgi:transcriptional regulator with XRE-family HTH domain
MTLGQAIRVIRLEGGLSQKDLAEAAGIDQSYLSMIESDQRRNPGTRIIARLAQALQVSIDDLASRAGYLPRLEPEDPLSSRAMRLFRQLPRWRQEDVLAQLELYLRLKEQQQPCTMGEEGSDVRLEETALAQRQAA